MEFRQVNTKEPIFLAGYSRGAAIVIQAARLLHEDSVEVSGLVLFDTVDRALGLTEIESITPNVRQFAHARRDPTVRSRPYFGYPNLRFDSSSTVRIFDRPYKATHSALGGLPWQGDHPVGPVKYVPPNTPYVLGKIGDPWREAEGVPTITKEEDTAAVHQIKADMWAAMRQMGMMR